MHRSSVTGRSSIRGLQSSLFGPPVDFRQWVRGTDPEKDNEGSPVNFDPADAPAVSPILHVTPDDPPTLLIHGDQDEVVNVSHSHRMYKALQEHGVETNLIVIEGAGHGFRGVDAERASAAMVEWFSTHLAEGN